MVIDNAGKPSKIIRIIRIQPSRDSLLRNPEKDDKVRPNSEEGAVSGISIMNDVAAEHYKSLENENSKMTRPHVVLNYELKRVLED